MEFAASLAHLSPKAGRGSEGGTVGEWDGRIALDGAGVDKR